VGAASVGRLGALIISNAQNATLNGTVTAASFTLTAARNATFNGAVTTGTSVVLTKSTGTIAFNGALLTPTLTITSQVNNLSLNGTGTAITNAVSFVNRGTLSLGSAGGSQTYTDGITVNGPSDGPISTSLASAITSSGNQTYTGPVLLSAATALSTSAGDILFNTAGATINGAAANTQALSVSASGVINFNGAIGSTPLSSLTVNAATININGGAIKTSGNQSYTGPVVLDAASNATTLTSTNSGAIRFSTPATTINGATANTQALTISDIGGTTTFNGAIGNIQPLSSLTVEAATININGGTISTYGNQSYTGAVVLGAAPPYATTLTSANSGSVSFSSRIDGTTANTQALTFTTAGAISVNGDIGSTSLSTLTVTNSSDATFNGAVTTGTSVVLTKSTGTTAFNGALLTPTLTITSQVNHLGLNGTGTAITNTVSFINKGTLSLGSAGGGQTYTGGITVNGPISGPIRTNLAGTITTSGNQTYTGPVLLSAATALSGNHILFNSIVDGAHDLTILSSTTTFKDSVGSITPLNSLFIKATTINMNGSKTITTTGAQTYDGAVVFGDDPVLQGNQITFKSTIDGPHPLKIVDTGTTTFSGVIGGVSPLDSLEVFAAMIRIGAGAITTYKPGTTTGFQNYRSSAISFIKETVLTGFGIKFTSKPTGTSYKLNDYADLSRFGMVVPASNGSGDTSNKKASDAAKTAARAAMFIIIPASGSYRSTLGSRQERYALLPNDDGKVGAITVTLAGQAEVLVKDAYSSISVDNGSTVDGADPSTTKEIYRNMQDAVPSSQ
jgi:hypothetical protein